MGFFSAAGFPAAFFPTTGFFSFLSPTAFFCFPPQASCPEPASDLTWLLVLLLPYPCGFCGSWPVEEWCSGTWSLRMG